MQLSAPAPTWLQSLRSVQIISSLNRFFAVRTWIGFTIGEALTWFGFVVMWPIILGTIYFFSGRFKSGNYMPAHEFIVVSSIVAVIKAVVIIPFWWLFLVKWKTMPVWKRAILHLPFGSLYSFVDVFIVYQIKTDVLHLKYPSGTVWLDGYNILASYFMNFMLFHAYNFWLSNQRQRKKEQELREVAFQSEINVLKAQIEPHFLFNTLNSISASVPPSLENTRVLISQLADTFRYALRVSESQDVLLSEELDFINTWLALEKHRFGDRLTIDLQVDKQLNEVMVPPLILQPLVENALNHGIGPKVEGGTVTIECKQRHDSIYIAVSDSGVGYNGDLEQMRSKSVGLTNICRRLKLLYNETLTVQRLHQGLCFSFQLPTTTK